MDMFRAAMLVATIFIGAIGALLGLVVLVAGLTTGSLTVAFGPGGSETITNASDPGRFLNYLLGLGAAPLVIGLVLTYFGLRRLRG